MADAENVDLNAPAFGVGSQKAIIDGNIVATVEPEAVIEETPVVEPEVTITPAAEEDSEEGRVKYSRFKKFHDRALEAEADAAHWKQIAESIKSPEPINNNQPDIPAFWSELYGDSEASQKAWQVQSKANAELIAQARSEALEAVRNERSLEAQRTEQNVAVLDENFEDLEAFVGRDLNDKEQAAILDIVDEYTPKDSNGNYAGAILPFDKAWEIYGLKQAATKAPTTKARDQVAGLSGAGSAGVSTVSEKDKAFNPLDWNAYKNLI